MSSGRPLGSNAFGCQDSFEGADSGVPARKGRGTMRLITALVAIAALMAFVASTASAGEITGNGRLLTVHGNSPCAFSGQEDLQWYTDNSDSTLRLDPTRGDPAYAQNWGHVKQDTGLTGGANSVPAAEWGCNAQLYGLK
jgi:hypothetical protein